MDKQAVEKYIGEAKRIEVPYLQEKFALTYSETSKLLSELEKKGAIRFLGGFVYETALQAPEPQTAEPPKSNPFIEAHKRAMRRTELRQRLRTIEIVNDDDDDDDDDDDNRESTPEEVEAAKRKREYLEQQRRELIESMRRDAENKAADNGDEKDAKETARNAMAARFREAVKKMPGYSAGDDTFSLKMNVAYPDGTPFRVKIVEHDEKFYISDCGNTYKYLTKASKWAALADFFGRDGKGSTRIIDNALCQEVVYILSLTCDARALFNLVNEMIESDDSDVAPTENMRRSAEAILVREDAELIVKALSMMDDDPVQAISLQRTLHIGYARAGRIMDFLTAFGFLEYDGSTARKSEKVTESLISYLKQRLAERP